MRWFSAIALGCLTIFAGIGPAFAADLYPHCPVRDEKCGYIDATGKWVLPRKFDYAAPFDRNGLAMVKIGKKYGLIDTTGSYATPPDYDIIFNARHAEAPYYPVKKDGLYGFLDDRGKVLFPLVFERAAPFSRSGLAAIKQGGKYGFIDTDGHIAIKPGFEAVGAFGENGLAPAKQGGKWGFITRTGAWAIQPGFDEANSFYGSNRAEVRINKKSGYVMMNGKLVIPAIYDSAFSFGKAGLAVVKKNYKWGAIDATGKVVIPLQFEDLHAFASDGAAEAKKNGKWGLIDSRGKWLIQPTFESLGYFGGGQLTSFTQAGSWGCVNRSGEVVVPALFSSVQCRDGDLTQVWFNENKQSGYLDQKFKPLTFNWADFGWPEKMLCSPYGDLTNVYTRPSTKSPVIKALGNGHIVKVTRESGTDKDITFAKVAFRMGAYSDQQTGYLNQKLLKDDCTALAARSAMVLAQKNMNRSYNFADHLPKLDNPRLSGRYLDAHFTYSLQPQNRDLNSLSNLCRPEFRLEKTWSDYSYNGGTYYVLPVTKVLKTNLTTGHSRIDTLGFGARMGKYDAFFGYQHGGAIAVAPTSRWTPADRDSSLVTIVDGRQDKRQLFEDDRDMLFIDIAPDARESLKWLYRLQKACRGELEY